jgi:hypothetical protein
METVMIAAFTSSLRAQRRNPASLSGDGLDCLVASLVAMTDSLIDGSARARGTAKGTR